MSRSATILTWVLRIAVGVLFIFSGFVKANDITGFSIKLDEYWTVFGTEFLKPTSLFLSWFLSVFEIALGFALIFGYLMRWTSWILLLMILFFTFLTWYSWYFEAVQDCGCFGDAIKLTPFQSFMKDIILTALIGVIFAFRNKIQPFPSNRIAAVGSFASFAAFGFFSWYCYRHLPMIDFIKEYKVGANVKENTTMDPNTGEVKDHYFDYEFCNGCPTDSVSGTGPKDGFKGSTLYVIMHNPANACQDCIASTAELYKQIQKELPALNMCGGTNKPDELNSFKLPYCVTGHDEKLMMMMVRSSPGFLLMKDGVVVKKWSAADMPDVAELRDLVK